MSTDSERLPWESVSVTSPPEPPEDGEFKQKAAEQAQRELGVLATLLEGVNRAETALVTGVLARVRHDDLLDHNHAHLFRIIEALHAAGKYVEGTTIKAHAHQEGYQIEDTVVDGLLKAKPITNRKELDLRIEQVVRAGSLRKADRAHRLVAGLIHGAELFDEHNLAQVAEEIQNTAAELSASSRRAASSVLVRTVKDELDSVLAGLARTHGKKFLGLPTGALPTLDKYTLGLRGFNFLAAAPGVGKTALGLQIGFDIVEQNTDATFVFFSFEMARADMHRRLLSMLSELPWKTIMLGSGSKLKTFNSKDGLLFTDEDRSAFDEAVDRLRTLGDRITIVDREGLPTVDYDAMCDVIADAKTRAEANRAFVLVDSLQAAPFQRGEGTPWSNDVERDNYVIGELLRLQRSTGDALMLIAEQNKEGLGKDTLKSPRGTARGVYSPDCVFIMQTPTDKDKDRAVEQDVKRTEVQLKIIKGRDGTYRGQIPLVFDYECSTFSEGFLDDQNTGHPGV